MLLTCPACAARFSLEAAVEDAEARGALAKAFELSELGPQVAAYLGLFRPPKRALAWRRVRRLVSELVETIEAGEIHRRGRAWTIEPGAFALGLAAVIERRDQGKLTTPLKDHAYLFETVINHSERLAGEAERKRDEERRGRPRPGPTPPPEEPVRLDPGVARKHLDAAWKAIGRTPPNREDANGGV